MSQLSYASIGPRAMRRLGAQFVNGISYAATANSATREVF